MVNLMPSSASTSSDSSSAAVSGSHMPFGLAAEAGFKIADAPNDLGDFVAAAGQGHDDVVVALGQRRAVAGKSLPAGLVRVHDGLVNVRALFPSSRTSRVGPKLKLILA